MTDCRHMTTAEYATHRGVSDSYVRRLRRKSLTVECSHGQIDVAATDAALGANLNPVRGGDRSAPSEVSSATVVPASASVVPSTVLKAPLGEPVSVAEAVRRGHLARARREELELGELAGDLTRVRDASRGVITLVRQAISDMRLMGTTLRTQLAATSDPRKCEELIEGEIVKICAEMQRRAEKLKGEWSRERGVDA